MRRRLAASSGPAPFPLTSAAADELMVVGMLTLATHTQMNGRKWTHIAPACGQGSAALSYLIKALMRKEMTALGLFQITAFTITFIVSVAWALAVVFCPLALYKRIERYFFMACFSFFSINSSVLFLMPLMPPSEYGDAAANIFLMRQWLLTAVVAVGVPMQECLEFLFIVHLPVHVVLDFAWRNNIACHSGEGICAGLTGWPPSPPTPSLAFAVARHLLLRALPQATLHTITLIVASFSLEVSRAEEAGGDAAEASSRSGLARARTPLGRLIRLVVGACLVLQTRLRSSWRAASSYSLGVAIAWPLLGLIVGVQVS